MDINRDKGLHSAYQIYSLLFVVTLSKLPLTSPQSGGGFSPAIAEFALGNPCSSADSVAIPFPWHSLQQLFSLSHFFTVCLLWLTSAFITHPFFFVFQCLCVLNTRSGCQSSRVWSYYFSLLAVSFGLACPYSCVYIIYNNLCVALFVTCSFKHWSSWLTYTHLVTTWHIHLWTGSQKQ